MKTLVNKIKIKLINGNFDQKKKKNQQKCVPGKCLGMYNTSKLFNSYLSASVVVVRTSMSLSGSVCSSPLFYYYSIDLYIIIR